MTTAVAPVGSALLVTVSGEVDALTAPRLVAVLAEQLQADLLATLIVDLRQVRFFASLGIAALIEARDLAAARGVRFRLVVDANRRVTRPLEMSGMAELLELHAELEDAVRADCCRGDDHTA